MTPPPTEALSIPCPPLLRIYGIARACIYNGANGDRNRKRQYKAAKRGKNERKPTSRATTQPQAQTPLKTAYTASAVQFTQAAAPTHEKTGIVLHNNTAVVKAHKNAKLSIKTSEKTLANAQKMVYYTLASEREQTQAPPTQRAGRTKKRTKSKQFGGQKNEKIYF